MNILFSERMLWMGLGIYWLLAAFFVKKSVKKQSGKQRFLYMLFWIVAFVLLFTDDFSFGFLYEPVFAQHAVYKYSGLIMCIGGLLFSVQARIFLGKNWSGRITIKEDHELIQSGPYAITRNPIYSGFLLAFAGCALSENLTKGYLGILFLFFGLLMKIYNEEKFMKEVFHEKYLSYKQRVKALIPFVY